MQELKSKGTGVVISYGFHQPKITHVDCDRLINTRLESHGETKHRYLQSCLRTYRHLQTLFFCLATTNSSSIMLDREKPGTKTFTETTPLLQKVAPIVPAQECQQHIQLLRCFLNLKQTVLKTKGLFKTEYVHKIKNELDPIARQSAAEESRWSIYVSRAIHRFSVWWTRLSVTGTPGPGSNQLLEKSYGPHGGWTWTGDQMPPLGIYS